MAPSKNSLMLAILIMFFFGIQNIYCSAEKNNDLEDDIAFLEYQETLFSATNTDTVTDQHHTKGSGGGGGDLEKDDQQTTSLPSTDEKDVVVLKAKNFTEFIEKNKYVMVEFYAPWCGHCQALAPEYAAAATELKGEAMLAKVDATEERGLVQMFEVEGFPTLYFFVDGVHKAYEGGRTKDEIVTWVKKKTGPPVHNITTTEEAERVLAAESKVVLGYLNTLVGPETEELAAASDSEDAVIFYQTSNPDVAKLFHIDPQVSRPALVLLKKEAEKISHFDGQFSEVAIAEFIASNKLPLVVTLSAENAASVFDHQINAKLILLATSNESENIVPTFQEAAKDFKGKIIFAYAAKDDNEIGEQVSGFFGVAGDAPPTIRALRGGEEAEKYAFDGELNLSNIKSFAEDLLKNKLKRFYSSEPIPDKNDGDVKIVVGHSFDKIVLDESKDVLLEVYAPWCGHCQALEPVYSRLGKYLRGIDSLVIAKMDGTTNEHPRIEVDGFPTLLFFPAGKKSSSPVQVETEHTVVAFYKFLKEHSSVPFKLDKPSSADNSNVAKHQNVNANNAKYKSTDNNVKDEL